MILDDLAAAADLLRNPHTRPRHMPAEVADALAALFDSTLATISAQLWVWNSHLETDGETTEQAMDRLIPAGAAFGPAVHAARTILATTTSPRKPAVDRPRTGAAFVAAARRAVSTAFDWLAAAAETDPTPHQGAAIGGARRALEVADTLIGHAGAAARPTPDPVVYTTMTGFGVSVFPPHLHNHPEAGPFLIDVTETGQDRWAVRRGTRCLNPTTGGWSTDGSASV